MEKHIAGKRVMSLTPLAAALAVLDGEEGSDCLLGNGGNDTYTYDLGDGQDHITGTAGNENDWRRAA